MDHGDIPSPVSKLLNLQTGMFSLFYSTSIAALRKNIGFIALFAFLTLTFACLAAGELAVSTG
jgi:succinate-acetate transporter protein